MKFKASHENFNVFDMEKSLKFYKDALGFVPRRHQVAEDGSYEIYHLMNSNGGDFEIELTWMREYDRPYDLGDCEFHLCFEADDYDAAYALHKKMGCIVFENNKMGKGLYFIADPDGYWIEIIHPKED